MGRFWILNKNEGTGVLPYQHLTVEKIKTIDENIYFGSSYTKKMILILLIRTFENT